jgi:hypothetical protein
MQSSGSNGAGQEENRVMMRQLLLLCAAMVLVASSGCTVLEKHCPNCGQKQALMQPAHQQVMQAQAQQQVMQAQAQQQVMPAQAMAPANLMMPQAGPDTAAYAYPYYTTRGPRDYFMKNPPSIGN